jgi:hypothetical protein
MVVMAVCLFVLHDLLVALCLRIAPTSRAQVGPPRVPLLA